MFGTHFRVPNPLSPASLALYTFMLTTIMQEATDHHVGRWPFGCWHDKQLGTRTLVLDGIQDPGNLGTLLRTALALGYCTLIP